MVRHLLFLTIFVMAGNCYGAELLVKASGHWLDSKTPEELSAMSQGELDSYNSRSQKGDIIVVRPDGWVWGKEECPPRYIVVKVPNMTVEEAKKYEEPLMEVLEPIGNKGEFVEGKMETVSEVQPKMLKVRKYSIPVAEVDASLNAKDQDFGKAVLSKVSAETMVKETSVTEATLMAVKMVEPIEELK